MTDESYDPHARMHESFPRVDSGSTQIADNTTYLPSTGRDSRDDDLAVAVKQVQNERSMRDIARRGASAVDPTNLVVMPGR